MHRPARVIMIPWMWREFSNTSVVDVSSLINATDSNTERFWKESNIKLKRHIAPTHWGVFNCHQTPGHNKWSILMRLASSWRYLSQNLIRQKAISWVHVLSPSQLFRARKGFTSRLQKCDFRGRLVSKAEEDNADDSKSNLWLNFSPRYTYSNTNQTAKQRGGAWLMTSRSIKDNETWLEGWKLPFSGAFILEYQSWANQCDNIRNKCHWFDSYKGVCSLWLYKKTWKRRELVLCEII